MAKYKSLDILEDAQELETRHKRQVHLSWNLIRFKIMYYYPELIDEEFKKPLKISDEKYDKLREEYLGLCMKLDVHNLVVDKMAKSGPTIVPGDGMSEVDFNRSAVKATLDYVGIDDWKTAVKAIEDKEKALKEGFTAGQKKAEEQDEDDDKNWAYPY